MNIDISTYDSFGDLNYLGSVQVPKRYVNPQGAIQNWYEEWKEAVRHPECASDFITWIVNNKKCKLIDSRRQVCVK